MKKSLLAILGVNVLLIQSSFALDLQQLKTSWSGAYDGQKIGVFIKSIDANQVKATAF